MIINNIISKKSENNIGDKYYLFYLLSLYYLVNLTFNLYISERIFYKINILSINLCIICIHY